MADDTTQTDSERFTKDQPNADSGGRAHTGLDEGHPAGDGPRSDREVGGPVAEQDAEDVTGKPGAHGDIQTKGMEPHQ
ncbi:MAG TPA: hypothetical protein VD931_11060 [Baekduia sp.]|nr:hypothetical protein [Baekduia sp.]